MRLNNQILLKSSSLNLLAGPAPKLIAVRWDEQFAQAAITSILMAYKKLVGVFVRVMFSAAY